MTSASPPDSEDLTLHSAVRDERSWARLGAAFVFAVLLATWIDRAAYPRLIDFGIRSERKLGALFDLFQTFGELSTWALVAAILVAVDYERAQVRALGERLARAKIVLLACLAAGLATAVLKALVRRGRPRDHDGEFWFRPYSDDLLSSSGFGMPSGDAALAFAGLFVLYRLYPSAWPVWFMLGYGCALCRTLSGAHFLSDVLVGATLGCVCASVVWTLHERRNTPSTLEVVGSRGMRAGPGVAWFLALAGSLFAVSATTSWKPAAESDVPGLYFSAQRTDSKSYFRFEKNGTYRGAILIADDPSRMELMEGSWSFGKEGLQLGDDSPRPLEISGKLIRWRDEGRITILTREGR